METDPDKVEGGDTEGGDGAEPDEGTGDGDGDTSGD